MDFSDFTGVMEKADSANSIGIYVLAGVGALLLVIVLAWGMLKLASFITKENKEKKQEKDDEEELFGE